MSDDFYNDFDRECFHDAFNPQRNPDDYRSAFHQDRDRVMFTPSFRRLQTKTQVFQAGEYDFYRTRLTHSLEVSRIAESLAIWIMRANPEVRIDLQLLEAICLAHDIGHPPFGHAGERVLNGLMRPYGGFEGNAQTLRILTCTIYNRPGGRGGMSPSRALLDGVLKYKRLHREKPDAKNHFIYDDQAEILEFCFGTADLAPLLPGGEANKFKSLECQVMDFADDIAYSCFDIVDGAKARFVSADRLDAWPAEEGSLERKYLNEMAAMLRDGTAQPKMNKLIGELIRSTSLEKTDNFMSPRTGRYGWRLACTPKAAARIALHKALSVELIFGSTALRQIEFKGERILGDLAGLIFDNYLGDQGRGIELVPREVHRAQDQADRPTRARLLCDYISGMTDAYALRSYKRLLDPDYGSISELI